MMKILLPSMCILMMMYNINMLLIIMSMIIMLLLLMLTQYSSMNIINSLFMMDPITLIMIILSIISSILIMLSSSMLKEISTTIIPITLILIITFIMSNMFLFYIMFEIVLIPTLILITKSGKQPERLQAGIYLLIYTVTASLPLLLGILHSNNSLNFYLSTTLNSQFNLTIIFMMAFMVKLPMFLTHLWLPKAHVEAPLEGSMILAAVLLKLGGYGLIRFLPMLFQKIYKLNHWLISISLVGATATGMNCIRQKDLKSLIAYSSVAHMGMVLASLMSLNQIGLIGSIIMMIGHGLSSSALFFLVNIIYSKYHTRNILMFKGLIHIIPNLTFWWFMFMAVNISAPPTINTISEIFIMTSLLSWNIITMISIFLASIMTASFSILLFMNISHNYTELLPSDNPQQKMFLSLMLHLIPLILMIMKMEMMFYYISLYKTTICGIVNTYIIMMSTLMTILSILLLPMALLFMLNSMFISFEIPFLSTLFMNMNVSILMDWMSMLFLSTVIFISSMILSFSMSYIPKNEHKQFSLMLLMFVLSMSILIMSDNVIFILLGWDGLGLSSFILVVYYQNSSSAASGYITILSNRIGDIMILMTISMLMIPTMWNFSMNEEFMLMTLLMLIIAAASKSAQFPFSAWLPAAMAAPTPISALVHSSTLVTAGVFLSLRIMSSPHPSTMSLILIISSMTTIYASLSANWEQDMKKIIALSTLSQIAMMMFAISMNLIYIAFFHLIIHALFKSTMFLCAGIMIHNSSYQDMRSMGSTFYNTPLTSSTLGITSFALMGLPFMSGFFSKDSIIEHMLYSKLYSNLSLIMIFSIGLTASYSIRMTMMSNKFVLKSKPDTTIHNSTPMDMPLIMLGPLSIFMGASMMWTLNPQQLFILPFNLKISIILTIMMGFLMGMSMSFKSKKYIMLGESSITLWFNHLMSTMPFSKLNFLMKSFLINDKNWQEMYGPYMINNQLYNNSKFPDKMMISLLFILLIITITPLMLMY